MRLFVAVRPPAKIIDAVAALPRPDIAGVRWTTTEQWHVTLRFLGNVDDPTPVTTALASAVRSVAPVAVTIGPRAAVLGRHIVYVPVTGLTEIAATVVEATKAFGDPPPTRPFRGHLTLARTKGRRVDLAPLALDDSWMVRAVELMRSRLGGDGARYETLERFELTD